MDKIDCILMVSWITAGTLIGMNIKMCPTHERITVCPNITCPNLPCVTEITYGCPGECYEKPEWLRAIESFHIGKEYINDSEAVRRGVPTYTCNDFSRELNRELRNSGVESYQVTGKCIHTDPPDTLHAYIKVCRYYEPQTGKDITGLCKG